MDEDVMYVVVANAVVEVLVSVIVVIVEVVVVMERAVYVVEVGDGSSNWLWCDGVVADVVVE